MTEADRASVEFALAALERSSPNLTVAHEWKPDGWREQRTEAIAHLRLVLATNPPPGLTATP